MNHICGKSLTSEVKQLLLPIIPTMIWDKN